MKKIVILTPLLIGLAIAVAQPRGGRDSFVNGPEHQGERVACELPANEQLWNRGGSDGAGMCVMTSIEMAARWQGLDQMRGLRDWCAQEPGGGYPRKVDDQLKRFCAAKGIECPPYVQYEGREVAEVLAMCDRTGRLACCTYGYSPRYGKTIAHMVCCPKHNNRWGVCQDNNKIGGVDEASRWEWMESPELVRRVCHPRGVGWVFVWLSPSPPPPLKASP